MIHEIKEVTQRRYFKESLYAIEVDKMKRIDFLRIISDLKGITFFQGFEEKQFTSVYKFIIKWHTMSELKEITNFTN